MSTIGRNKPCPCGSGKKYKQCCAAKQPATITAILDAEMIQLKQEILNFAVTNYEDIIDNIIDDISEEVQIESEEQFDKAAYFLMLWIIFTLPILENNKTILQQYIAKNRMKIKRPALKEALDRWQKAAPSIYKVITERDQYLIVEDIFSNEEKQVQTVGLNIMEETEHSIEGQYVLGLVIEYQNRASFFTTYYVIKDEIIIEDILNYYETDSNDYSPTAYVKEFFVELIHFIFAGPPINIDDIAWDTKQQKEVIELVRENLILSNEIIKPIEGISIALWKSYCMKTGANIRSVSNYAAALHYIVGYFYIFFGEDAPSKQDIVNIYNIKMRSLTTAITKLEDVLDEEITELVDRLMSDIEDVEDENEDFFYEADYDFDEDDDFISLENLFSEADELEIVEPIVDELAARRKAKQSKK